MEKLCTLFLLLISLTASAQSDFDIAREFMSKKGVILKDNPRTRSLDEKKPYSVFNGENNKGFAIVVNGCVVGYDTENTANEDDMPCCLKDMLLDSYSKTVNAAKTRSDYTSDHIPDWWTPRDVTPIEPLLTSHWSQGSPYNDMLEKKSGICTIIAWTQILHYFRVPQTYEDKVTNDGKSFPITFFNHDLILNRYSYGAYTEEEAHEVANFIYYYWNIDSYGIETYYGMKKDTVWTTKDNHYLETDEYLERGLPIWTCGVHNNVGHAFVIDGRDSEGRYHVNFGWGGGSDGYYVMPNCKEYDNYYDGDNSILGYVDRALWQYYVIIPRLFSWSYTSNIYKPNFDVAKVSSTDVYNLQGVKVGNSLEGLPKGVYIQGGKKIVK